MEEPKRQHPIMILMIMSEHIIPFGFSLILGIFLSIREIWALLVILFIIFLMLFIFAYIKWFMFTYQIGQKELVIRWGVLARREITVSADNLTDLEESTPSIAGFFGVSSLGIEVETGEQKENVTLGFIPKTDKEKIKMILQEKEMPDEKIEEGLEIMYERPAQEQRVLASYQVENSDIILAGATSGRFFMAIMVISFVLSQVQTFLPGRFMELVKELFAGATPVAVIVLLLLVLFMAWVVSTFIYFVQYCGFTVERREEELVIKRGLLEQKEVRIGIHNIQALVMHEGLLRQPLGLLSLEVRATKNSGEGSKNVIVHPLIRSSQLPFFLEHILPGYRFTYTLNSLNPQAYMLYFIQVMPLIMLVSIPFIFLPYGFLIVLALLAGGLIYVNNAFTDTAYAFEENKLILRYRTLSRFTAIIPVGKIQALEISRSPILQGRDLNTIIPYIIGEAGKNSFPLYGLGNDAVWQIRQWFIHWQKSR